MMGHSYIILVVCICVFHGSARILASTSTGYRSRSSCEDPGPIENGEVTTSLYPTIRHYRCSQGYRLRGQPKQVCSSSGQWQPPQKPTCVSEVSCPSSVYVTNGITRLETELSKVGQAGNVECNPGFVMQINGEYKTNLHILCSQDGHWTTEQGWLEIPSCTVRICNSAPVVPHASMSVNPILAQPVEGSKVSYRCNSGYTLISGAESGILTCRGNGQWDGALPSCVESLSCQQPKNIIQGQWQTVKDIENIYLKHTYSDEYPVGIKVKYMCYPGNKMLGSSVIECLDDRLWSHIPPKCIGIDETALYCPTIPTISNGGCGCNTKKDLSYCAPFYEGIQVECVCDSGYQISGPSILTCAVDGSWDNEIPRCIKDFIDEVSGSLPNEGNTRMSSLAIVIATACSVLGILLLVMVIMVFRRRKPRPHLCHPTSPAPPPYSRVHNAIDEHDRVALIGYETQGVALPSYEEATRAHGRRHGGLRDSGLPGEYRQLPSIPTNMRTNLQTISETSSNRHSIITTSTVNRDAISEIFGSLDTVNVSMSDASTSVTVETFDSGGSNPSNTSGRATAGSLGSSNGSLATEDMPLLENTGQVEESSEASEEPEDTKEI